MTKTVAKTPLERCDEKEWRRFYNRIGNLVVAKQVLQAFAANPSWQQSSPGLYMRARETVEKHARRAARRSRILQVFRAPALADQDSRLLERLCARVSKPSAAAEVVRYLDQNPVLKDQMKAVYMRASETLELAEQRRRRYRTMVNAMRRLFGRKVPLSRIAVPQELHSQPAPALSPDVAAVAAPAAAERRAADLAASPEFVGAYESFSKQEPKFAAAKVG